MDRRLLAAMLGKDDLLARNRVKRGQRLVHYTSAQNAYRIVEQAQIWMRSAALMNDYSEIEHGLACLRKAWTSAPGEALRAMLGRIGADFRQEVEALCDGNASNFKFDTYITSLSEHDDGEDEMGRLSMWRAYGGNAGVALVLNTSIFLGNTRTMGVFVTPVRYMCEDAFLEFFVQWSKQILRKEALLSSFDKDYLKDGLYTQFRIFAMATKHPGFKEEREWRMFTSPSHEGVSDWLHYDIETVRGIPQKVAKLRLFDDYGRGIIGAHPSALLNRMIIGPCEHPMHIREALISVMERSDVAEASSKAWVSNIPLREK